jgi:hypothetical protein
MKKVLMFGMGMLLSLSAVSCSDDDSSSSTNSPSEVTETLTAGTWRITSFTEDGEDRTPSFSNYNFTFSSSNTVSATNGTNTYTGAWSVTSEDDDDDNPSSDVDFNLLFSTPPSFAELNEDWDIVSRRSDRLQLRHVSGGDGSVDTLVLEKN